MSLSSDDLADIKQLMTSLLNAQENRIEANMKEVMDRRFKEQDKRIDERFEEQDEKLNEILNAIGTRFNNQDETSASHVKQIEDHERRILQLEKQVA